MIDINATVSGRIDRKMMLLVTEGFLRYYKKAKYDVSIAMVGEARMRRLNRIYRGMDKSTDVLSFAENGQDRLPGERPCLGEVVLCRDVISRQAGEYGRSPRQELAFVLVHGLLHLIGRNDETEKGRLAMIEEGERFLKNFKYQ